MTSANDFNTAIIAEFRARAAIAAGTERERLFNQMAEVMPGFAEYQHNTERHLPVIILDRID